MTPPIQSIPCICGEPDCGIPFGLCHCGCGGRCNISEKTYLAAKWIKGMPFRCLRRHKTRTRGAVNDFLCVCGNPQCALIGYCHCGCGQMVKPAKGYGKRGKTQYLWGHHRRIRPDLEEVAPFKIDGEYCRLIPLQDGIYAIVDQCDYARLMRYKWHADFNKSNGTIYVLRRGPKGQIFMHREILGMEDTDERTGDHVNLVTLDNRRKNLRIATPAQNSQNRRRARNNTTGYKGVQRKKSTTKYTAVIYPNGQEIYLGRRDTAEEAHALYCEAAVKYYGEFARFA